MRYFTYFSGNAKDGKIRIEGYWSFGSTTISIYKGYLHVMITCQNRNYLKYYDIKLISIINLVNK